MTGTTEDRSRPSAPPTTLRRVAASPEEQGRTSIADDEAFRQFVVPEIETMLRVAGTLTRDTGEAEDLVQDALVRAYRGIAGFDGRYPRAWLLTIVRNTHINRGRRKRPEPAEDPDADLDRVARHTTESTVEASVVDIVIDDVVQECLRELPRDQLRIVELVDVAGLTYREAAEKIDVPIGTVMSRLHRARKRMRDHLVRAGIGPGRSRR
ncbi:MAG: sigma-70 family RNA polymerase sigma factor [Actinobacteria bacterium]|nr:sigma-70 family RNA polymerase sigma factor [Actinomycetota bacterium]